MEVARDVPESVPEAVPGAPFATVARSARAIRVVLVFLCASLILTFADAAIVAFAVPMPAGGVPLRIEHLVFDAAETLGIGAVVAFAFGGFVRFVPLPPLAEFLLGTALGLLILHVVIGENVTRVTEHLVPASFVRVAALGYLALLSAALPELCRFAERLVRGRPGLGVPVALLALGVIGVDAAILSDDYPGVHGVVAAIVAMTGGAALAPVMQRRLAAVGTRAGGRLAIGLVSLVGLFGLVWPPANAVRFELFRQPCAVAPWVLATIFWRPPSLHGRAPAVAPSPWSRDRSADPPVPRTTPGLLPDGAVVALVSIDATRADAVLDPANAALFPTFAALAREGVVFRHAMAAGSQTPLTLAAVFSGRPFSEQVWSEHGEQRVRFLYPADDTSVRFPEVLSEHGVETFNAVGLAFMTNDFGVARGFREQSVAVRGMEHAYAADLVDRVLGKLAQAGAGPLFLYTHLMEPHEPYDRGRTDGTDFERYLSEIAIADANIGRVLGYLKEHFPGRWALLVTSDHGEAFGEHGTREHAKSLYEELVHVPLFVAGANVAPRVVDQRVSLVDLGPTILDLFGEDTPPTFLGQSLVPLLAGRNAELTRPIFAEGRLRRALVTPDGLKVIEDLRRKTVEVYDLVSDPGETRNLFDVDTARSDAALAALRTFFAAHTRTEGGYTPPFKP
jgi:sulfatase-like protein